MAIRRGWEQLSESYRSRLVKGGVTRSDYEAGVSLKGARGHKATPENARELAKHPEKFKEYNERQKKYRKARKDLVERVVAKKKRAFEHTLRWNEEHSGLFVRNPPYMTKKIGLEVRRATMAQLRKVDAMTDSEFIEYQYEVRQDDDWRALWYH